MGVVAGQYMIPSDFSERIKRLRQKLGLSRKDLAELLDVSSTLVKQWESGRLQPSIQEWQRIALAESGGISALKKNNLRQNVFRETEIRYETEPDIAPTIDFAANPEAVRTAVEGIRLSYGHLFNPTFATEIARIEPLPHQRIAVYDHMLKQNRLRFLLADDAGAGKTIMTGLYIREMLTRRLISRVLIVPPAGLVGNWEHEMRNLFNLPFRIITSNNARSDNPFTGPKSDLLIVSVDTLAGERMFSRLHEARVTPYDLAAFDEAHKLAADRGADFYMRKTDPYRLAEAFAGIPDEDEKWSLAWSCPHLLLLTATPHMGKDFPYYCLWRLLEPGDVVDVAIQAAVKEKKLWLTSETASFFAEDIPAGVLSDNAYLQAPPQPVPVKDIRPENLPEAWSGETTTALEISHALSTKVGKMLPWITVREAIDGAFRSRLIERTDDSGGWPCGYENARFVKIWLPREQAQSPVSSPPSDLHLPRPSSKPSLLVAQAPLRVDEVQDLADHISEIAKAAIGLDLKLSVRIELASTPPPSEEVVARINQLLQPSCSLPPALCAHATWRSSRSGDSTPSGA